MEVSRRYDTWVQPYMYCDRVGSAIAGCRALTSRSGAEAEKEPRL